MFTIGMGMIRTSLKKEHQFPTRKDEKKLTVGD